MTTLHIEHAIKDLSMWRAAFDRAEPMRAKHGVRGFHISQPADDPLYIVVDLTFDSATAAEAFLVDLHQIWRTPTASPALAGAPQTRILETVEQRTLATAAAEPAEA